MATAVLLSGCNPFYSTEQSDVERGYRWIARNDYGQAMATFRQALERDPESGLATLGFADALADSGRNVEAIPVYTRALERLRMAGLASDVPHTGPTQVIGQALFSYQNQGLRFPHGVAAYAYFRRGLAYDVVVKREKPAPADFRSLAIQDFAEAARLAPSWDEPVKRQACLQQVDKIDCV
ncbi:MAG: tetratricopeptide repeat protein [Proteobacteria bacterium]|nr:tetratricopeptide repeat protein [Pseudomonadota bacterium]